MPNALDPERMTADERLDEVADILATGLARWNELKNANNSNALREFPLDFSPAKSGHEPQLKPRKGRIR
ncbi:MAG: hypothetical protein CMF63_03150 [Magnetovibrio sp.]|jgi:hypothetical protein|nr:hypothetical protein [Magnetovibrio sp.]